jgi:acetyl esterase/lipase
MRHILTATLLLTLAALTGCAPVGLALLNSLSNSSHYASHRSLPYGPLPRQTVDVYIPSPAPPTPAPVAVFFIGGRWTDNNAHNFFFVGEALASHGIVAVIVDQRFYPQVKFPTFEQDGAQAIAWTRDHIAAFHGNPHNLFLIGYSSGAHTAAMLSLDPEYLAAVNGSPTAWLRGTIGIAGPYDFLPLQQPDLKAIFGPPSQEWRSQPINFVTPHAPPMLLLQGKADLNVNPDNATHLAEKLAAAGDSARIIFYDQVDHYRIIAAMGHPVRSWAPTLQDITTFIQTHSQPSPTL